MTFFFDRSIGTRLPTALQSLRSPVPVEWHERWFKPDELDDVWLPEVGRRGWTVIGQDYRYHENSTELAAIQQHGIGVFYIWGAEATAWESFRVLARAYDRIMAANDSTTRPFFYRIYSDSRIRLLSI